MANKRVRQTPRIALGKLSNAGLDGNTYSAWSRWLLLLVLAALLVRLGFRIYGSWQRSEGFAGATVALVVVGWLFVEFLTRSMGGFTVLEDGSIQPQTVAFLRRSAAVQQRLLDVHPHLDPDRLRDGDPVRCDQGRAGGTLAAPASTAPARVSSSST